MSLWGIFNYASHAFGLKCFNINWIECLCYNNPFLWINHTFSAFNLLKPRFTQKEHSNKKLKSYQRIGPHNFDILSVIFGLLLGDGYAEKRANGTRICIYQEASHENYLLWLHSLISQLGYCNPTAPKLTTRLGHKNKIRTVIRFKTWTYSSFNWIHDIFYFNKIKIVPSILGNYFTPLALAVWIMDDGAKLGKGLKLCTNSFSFAECNLLVQILYKNFNLKASVQSAGAVNKTEFHIYIWSESMPLLREIIEPYVHSSMKYKIL